MPREADRRIVIDVMRYFLRNPQVTDTLEGIARWRLLDERISESVAETRAAITWLVRNGYLKELTPKATDPLFQLNADARARAVELVTAATPPVLENQRE